MKFSRRCFLASAAGASVMAIGGIAMARGAPSVKMAQVILYSPDYLFQQRLSVSDLTSYINSLVAEAGNCISGAKRNDKASTIVAVIIKPHGRSRISVISDDDKSYLTLFGPRLQNIHVPDVSEGPLAFAIYLDINGGNGKPPADFVLPQDWLEAMPEGGGPLDDTFFNKLLPD